MVTLRSGQYWAHAGHEQLDDYVNNMRPRLMTGMNHLTDNKEETGTLSLLVMTNLDDDGTERRETSVLAHFISLAQLEKWSASHKTHLAKRNRVFQPRDQAARSGAARCAGRHRQPDRSVHRAQASRNGAAGQ
jgi:Haem-containing dehydratase